MHFRKLYNQTLNLLLITEKDKSHYVFIKDFNRLIFSRTKHKDKNIIASLHSHLQISCHSICLVSLVLDSRLKALTFKFLTTLGTHNFAHG